MNKNFNLSELHANQKLPDDIIYYNIAISNSTVDFMPAVYNQIAQVPILEKPDEYFMTITRFSIPGQSIPIFHFLKSSVDKPLNGYWLSLTYLNQTFSTELIYFPEIDTTNYTGDNNTIYSYNAFVNMMNVAMQTCYTAVLNYCIEESLPAPPQTEAPFFQYNAVNHLVSLYCQTSYDPAVSGLLNQMTISMNNILYYFFNNFFVQRVGDQSPNHRDYDFIITNQHNNYITSDTNNPDITFPYYKNQQEYPTLYNWNDSTTITFTSCLFPTSAEYAPTTQNQVLNSEKILTDFEPLQTLSDPSGFRGYLQYYASGPYRLINLTTNSPLTNIDLQVFYKDELGNTYPLIINRNSTLSVKIAFIKKSLYKATYY